MGTHGTSAIVFGLSGIGLNVIKDLKMAGADLIIGFDVNNSKKDWGERFGMSRFVKPIENDGELFAHLVNMRKRDADQISGGDYIFYYISKVKVKRMTLEASHCGWGKMIIVGVVAAGQKISTRPCQLVSGRQGKGMAFGGASVRTDVP